MQVISASRRTDIPAFYTRWFINRLRAGYCHWQNPFGGQVYRVSLLPEDCLAVVSWTRNPALLMPHLGWLDGQGYRYYFHVTLNGYPPVLDPHSPPVDAGLDAFKRLAGRVSPENVMWRYDPIVISPVTPPEFHLENFDRLARALEGFTARCYFSFTSLYAKTRRRMDEVTKLEPVAYRALEFAAPDVTAPDVAAPVFAAPDLALRADLAGDLAQIAATRGITLYACCEPGLAGGPIEQAHCIDAGTIRRLSGRPDAVLRRAPSRKGCGCVASVDVGAYDTCLHGCVYCYATRSHSRALARFREHDPDDSIIFRPPRLKGIDLSTVEAPLKRAEKSSGQLRLS